jgi:hypothetical protein
MPTQANAYVLVLTNGKTFSNLPEHTWADYTKMADKLPNFVQHLTPLPPMPAPPQVHQPPPQLQQIPQMLVQPQQQQFQHRLINKVSEAHQGAVPLPIMEHRILAAHLRPCRPGLGRCLPSMPRDHELHIILLI